MKITFGTIIQNITRGIQIKNSELEKLFSNEPTPYEYLKIGNIENGLLVGNRTYLNPLESKYQKYCLKDQQLVLTKTGYPPKIYVHQANESHYLASGNFYLIDINLEKANPFYLAAFFNSDLGKLALMKVTVGQFIPNISLSDLREMPLELPSLAEQEGVATQYLETLQRIQSLNANLEKEVEKLQHLL